MVTKKTLNILKDVGQRRNNPNFIPQTCINKGRKDVVLPLCLNVKSTAPTFIQRQNATWVGN